MAMTAIDAVLDDPRFLADVRKGRRMPAETYDRLESARLLAACNSRYATGQRNQAMIATMLRTGIRVGEALALTTDDVRGGLLHVRHGKGDRARRLGIDARTDRMIRGWIQRRAALDIGGSTRAP